MTWFHDARRRLFAAAYVRADPGLRRTTGEPRQRLLDGLAGEVLEVGTGTGANFPHYPPAARVLATDDSEYMVRHAREAAEREAGRGRQIVVEVADAGALPYEDERFDAVVGALVFCSVPDQRRALAEAMRVLKPGGELRLFEHVRSQRRTVASLQRVATPAWGFFVDGCHLDRDTLAAVREAGFDVERVDDDTGPMPLRHLLIFARKWPQGQSRAEVNSPAT